MNFDIIKLRFTIFLLDLFDLIAFLFFVVGIVLTVRFFIFNPFTVVGKSMEPTFEQGDFIIVDKVTPKYGTLERGDILVFVPDDKDVPFIKRIIGMPGETVVLDGGDMYVCDGLVGEDDVVEPRDNQGCFKSDISFLAPGTVTNATGNKTVFPVQEDGYFVSGDNREHSTDSRSCFGGGCYAGANYLVYPRNIIGKVSVRLYPSIDSF